MTETCPKCKTDAASGAVVCPQCGYSAEQKLKRDGWLTFGAGFLISLSVVGVVLGVPLMLLGVHRINKARGLPISYEFSGVL